MASDYRAALVEQIRRDTETLTNPAHHVDQDPCGREFYEQRIASFKDAVRALAATKYIVTFDYGNGEQAIVVEATDKMDAVRQLNEHPEYGGSELIDIAEDSDAPLP